MTPAPIVEGKFRARYTKTRYGRFESVLNRNPRSRFERRLARLMVLYEDLRIESQAIIPDALGELDILGPNYRQQYFIRRAIATAVEFQQAIEQIESTPEFASIRIMAENSQDKYYTEDWVPAIRFFRSNRSLLKGVRNHVGGHFGEQAIDNAFAGMDPEYTIRTEIQFDHDDKVRLMMPFTMELVAVALLKHINGQSVEQRAKVLGDLLLSFVEHAVGAVHFLVASVLWQRMS